MSAREAGLRRLPTPDEIEAFWADGAVVLRGVLDLGYVASMAPHVDALLELPELVDMTAMGDSLARSGATVLREGARNGRFRSGVDHWLGHPAFARLACDSGLPAIAAAILRASKLNLWEDSVLVKEPSSGERTAWHQDLSYFHVSGEQLCTTWIPLDETDAETGAMSFVRGSHRWPDLYRPNLFVTALSIPGTGGVDVPDVDAMAARGEAELVQWSLGPGDVSVHHARTLHAAGANRSADRWRRAISIRYCGDDARYCFRPGAPRKSHHAEVRDGDVLDHARCPVVWRSAAPN
jgi:ectoine hydroxylase-related dioxygenase (phytanoyl-CoA dioxygenase family)